MKIALPSNHEFQIDQADFNFISSGHWFVARRSNGIYVRGYIERSGPKLYLHSFLMTPGKGFVVDHINGDGLDNRRCNLRVCLQALNCLNAPKKRATKTFKGVYLDKRNGTFYAQIFHLRRAYQSYGHAIAHDAALAYDRLAVSHHGDFARLNFPSGIAVP